MNLKTINTIVLRVLIALCILTLIGLLNFGHGLGNIIYFPPIILATLFHFLITRRLNKKNNDKYWLPIIIISSLICLSIIYNTTLGRGGEFAWDGRIFFIK
ncbi:hypothetical protein LPB85_16105 [Chryseobacterium sp. LC2016-27]|jgi:hypothetical protein|uniref:hypothetical protein n=1 Tax=Chryseobacterium sp. LC2016-27 TaxID=2897326 RepID=UPI001E4E37D8|nr:hypothetical protein [Chryseobacterium sp. LC2016-27]MCD0456973.1 hypothetical protein [Chryseobacterium sp. LC2016-27]